MDRSWMYNMKRSTLEFRNLVKEKFVRCAVENAVRKGETRILCPCLDCENLEKVLTPDVCVDHLVLRGFVKDYTRWIFHGEPIGISGIEIGRQETREDVNDDDIERDRIDSLIDDVQVNFEDETRVLERLLSDAEKPLYPNCDRFTRLSAVMNLMSLKVENRWSDKSFTALLELLDDILPVGHVLPKSTYEAKKVMCPIGCDYEKIHACPNDCILYRKKYKDLHKCPKCQTSRYRVKDKDGSCEKKKGSPAKVVWYLPIIPRFKRFFANVNEAKKLRWHSEMRKKDGKLRHPADAPQWRTIDRKFPEFGKDSRNLRLGLCTDGMNPFSTLSSQHSTWPVLLCIYNLPPYLCIKRKYLMLSLLIQGPKQPGNDIDVYLEPLIDDLRLLWDEGVMVYDSVAKENFKLHAMLLCTINDFPAYGNLSGYSVKGKKACPICDEGTVAPWLTYSGKNVYTNYRRFLRRNHPYRKMKKAFNGTVENKMAPIPLEADEVFQQVKDINVVYGKPNRFLKNAKYKKKSIFWDLPYWQHLPVRHCIDIMHVEKNVAESLIGTLLNIPGKTKDGYKARKDIEEMGIRKELAPQENGKRAYLPPACYTLSKKEKTTVCECILGISPSAANKVGQTSKDCVIKPNPIELKEPTNCRLTCVHDGVISNVAEATVYPNEDDTELVHGTPLLVGNVRVSIDKVLEGTAPLPVPTEFLERVADAAGSFVQWPKELIVIGNEESLSIRPSTGKKQKRTSKGCVIKPTSAPNPIELTEPTKCRLTCVHDGVIFNVAEATVYPNEDDTELVHGTPLLVGNVRVSIDKVLEGTAPLPVPTEFLERVADAAGSFVQWPKELIVIGDEESLSIRPSAPKKQKQTSKGSTIRPTSEPKIDDYISTIGPECKKLHDLLSLMVLEAKIFDVVLPSKVFFFETDKTIFVTEEDINQLLRMAFLNVSCIQLFMMYLQKHCEEKIEGSSSIAFLCPTIISQIGNDKELNNEVMKYVENSLYQMKNAGIVLVPFCQEMHWMLIILCPLVQEAYFCDPLSKKRDVTFKYLLKGAFRGFKARGGYTLKSGMSLKWSNLECPQQPGSTECGYYVMRYMLDIVRHYNQNITDYNKWFGSKKAYTVEEVDEVRDLWATYLMTNHF